MPDPSPREIAEAVLSSLPSRSVSALSRRIRKARHTHPIAVELDAHCDGDLECSALLWALVRGGHLDLQHEILWAALAEDTSSADGDDVMTLLKGVTDASPGAALPRWSDSLDAIVWDVADRDPTLLDAPRGALADSVAGGLATVDLRRDRIAREDLPACDWAAALAALHVDGRLGRGGASQGVHVRWARHAFDHPRWGVCLWDRERQRPTPRFYELIALFTPREAFAAAVLERSLEERRLSSAFIVDALGVAEPPALASLLTKLSDPPARLIDVLDELRPDLSGDALLAIVDALPERRPAVRDAVRACAIRRLARAGGELNPELLSRLDFTGLEVDPRGQLTGHSVYLEALRAFPSARAHSHLARCLQRGSTPAVPFVADYLTDALWETCLTCLRAAVPSRPVGRHALAARGLARLGPNELHRLVTAFDAENDARLRDLFAWGIIECLAVEADAGRSWDASLDRFIRFDLWLGGAADAFSGVRPALERALVALDGARLAAVYERGLDPGENPRVERALRAMRADAPDGVVEFAFMMLATDGVSLARRDPHVITWLVGAGGLSTRADPFVRAALGDGLDDAVAHLLERGMGRERWSAMHPGAATPRPPGVSPPPFETVLERFRSVTDPELVKIDGGDAQLRELWITGGEAPPALIARGAPGEASLLADSRDATRALGALLQLPTATRYAGDATVTTRFARGVWSMSMVQPHAERGLEYLFATLRVDDGVAFVLLRGADVEAMQRVLGIDDAARLVAARDEQETHLSPDE